MTYHPHWVLFAVVTLAGCSASVTDNKPTDGTRPGSTAILAALQGDWLLVSSGVNATVDVKDADGKMRMWVKDDKVVIQSEPGFTPVVHKVFKVRLFPQLNPMALDFVPREAGQPVQEGIFKLDGDTLTIFLDPRNNRPTSFAQTPKLFQATFVWKRDPNPPKREEPERISVDQKKELAPALIDEKGVIPEWPCEVTTKRGGKVVFRVTMPLPRHAPLFVLSVVVYNDQGYKTYLAKNPNNPPRKTDILLHVDMKSAAKVEQEVTLPPGASWFVIRNGSLATAEVRFHCHSTD